MKSLKKMNYSIALLVLTIFSFNLTASTDFLDEGIISLNKAKRAQILQMNQSDITGYLHDAYSCFKKCDETKAKFLQIYVGQRIGLDKEIEKTAASILNGHRKEYITIIANINELDENEKMLLKKVILTEEEKIPFIEAIDLKKKVIFPYRDENPWLKFNLNQAAKVSLSVDDNPESSGNFPRGEGLIVINWKDSFIEKGSLRLGLNTLNNFYSDSKQCDMQLEVKMPDSLQFSTGTFGIQGKQFKEESKLVKKPNGNYLWGIVLGMGLGYLAYSFKKDTQTGEFYTNSQRVTHGIIVGGLFCVMSLICLFRFPKKSHVPHQENIAYNKELSRQIDEKKKEIMIKLNLENN